MSCSLTLPFSQPDPRRRSGSLPTRVHAIASTPMADQSIPPLASDVRRAFLGVVPAAVPTVVLSLTVFADLPPSIEVTTVALLAWTCFALSYSVLTLWAVRGLRGDRLERALLPAEPTEPKWIRRGLRLPGMRTMLTGGQGPSWSAQVSLVALGVATMPAPRPPSTGWHSPVPSRPRSPTSCTSPPR